MLKTTKEFDFVYKNSYKFRTEMLDICVLKPNLAEQFFARFRRLPCNVVGFSVSKKVGIAVERNLVKRRLRAICREFFGLGNSSLGASCGDLANFECSQTSSLVSHSKFAKNSTTSTANTRIVDSNKSDSSDFKRGSIFDEKSGLRSHEQGNKTWSLLTKRVASLPDLSHPAGCKALAEAKKDNAQNLICIFIAKSQILQTPFATLKDSIFATLKKQMRFMKNTHSAPKMANRYELTKRESYKMANRPQTKAKQNENR